MVQSTRSGRTRAETSSASEETDGETAGTASDEVHIATRPSSVRRPRKSAPISISRSATVTSGRGARKTAAVIASPGPESQVIALSRADTETDTGDSGSQAILIQTRPRGGSRRTARKQPVRQRQVDPPSSNDEQQEGEKEDDIREYSEDDDEEEPDVTLRQSSPRQIARTKRTRSPAKRVSAPIDESHVTSEIEEDTDENVDAPITKRQKTRDTAKKVNFEMASEEPAARTTRRSGSPKQSASTDAIAHSADTTRARPATRAAQDLTAVAEQAVEGIEMLLDRKFLDLTKKDRMGIEKYCLRRSTVVDLAQAGGLFTPVKAALRNSNQPDALLVDQLSFLFALLMLYSDYDSPAISTLTSIHKHFAHLFPRAQLRQDGNMKLRISVSLQIVIAVRLFREENVKWQDYLDPSLANSPAYGRALDLDDRKKYRALVNAAWEDVFDGQTSVSKLRIKYPFEALVMQGIEEIRKTFNKGGATTLASEIVAESAAGTGLKVSSRKRTISGTTQADEDHAADEDDAALNRSFHAVAARLAASSADVRRPVSSPAIHKSRLSLDRIKAMSSPYKKLDVRRRSEPFQSSRSTLLWPSEGLNVERQSPPTDNDGNSDSDADDIERRLLGSQTSDVDDGFTRIVRSGYEVSESEEQVQFETQIMDQALLAEPSAINDRVEGNGVEVEAKYNMRYERMESTEEPEQTQATLHQTQSNVIALRGATAGEFEGDTSAELSGIAAPHPTASRTLGFDNQNRLVSRVGGARTRSTLLDRQDNAIRIAMDSPGSTSVAPGSNEATPRADRSSRIRQSKAEPPSSTALAAGLATSSAIKVTRYLDRGRYTPISQSPPATDIHSSPMPADAANTMPIDAEFALTRANATEIDRNSHSDASSARQSLKQTASAMRKVAHKNNSRRRSDFETSASSEESAQKASQVGSGKASKVSASDVTKVPTRVRKTSHRSTMRHTDLEQSAKSQRPPSAALPSERRNARQSRYQDDSDSHLPEVGKSSVAVASREQLAPVRSPQMLAQPKRTGVDPASPSAPAKLPPRKGKQRAVSSDEDELAQDSSQDEQRVDDRIRQAIGSSTNSTGVRRIAAGRPNRYYGEKKRYEYYYKARDGHRRWTAEQDAVLINALEEQSEAMTDEQRQNPRWNWGKILSEHGRNPEDVLYGKNNVQLKDRAYNLAIKRNRDGHEKRPWYSKQAR